MCLYKNLATLFMFMIITQKIFKAQLYRTKNIILKNAKDKH